MSGLPNELALKSEVEPVFRKCLTSKIVLSSLELR